MGDDGARTECEATRVGAKDQVWGEAGMDPRKKCMKKDDEIADLRDTSLIMIKKGSSGRKKGAGLDFETRSNLLVNAYIDEPLVISRIRILCRNFAAFLERRACDVAHWIVERVELSSNIDRELRRVHVPVNDFGVGVAISTRGPRGLGCVKGSIVVGVERCQCWTN